jgi:hypothetical protein
VSFTVSRFGWAAASRLVPPHYLIGLEMGCMLLRCESDEIHPPPSLANTDGQCPIYPQ